MWTEISERHCIYCLFYCGLFTIRLDSISKLLLQPIEYFTLVSDWTYSDYFWFFFQLFNGWKIKRKKHASLKTTRKSSLYCSLFLHWIQAALLFFGWWEVFFVVRFSTRLDDWMGHRTGSLVRQITMAGISEKSRDRVEDTVLTALLFCPLSVNKNRPVISLKRRLFFYPTCLPSFGWVCHLIASRNGASYKCTHLNRHALIVHTIELKYTPGKWDSLHCV